MTEQRAHEFAQQQHVESWAALAAVAAIAAEVHGHGADTLEGEMWRLRTIINRIDAVVSEVRNV